MEAIRCRRPIAMRTRSRSGVSAPRWCFDTPRFIGAWRPLDSSKNTRHHPCPASIPLDSPNFAGYTFPPESRFATTLDSSKNARRHPCPASVPLDSPNFAGYTPLKLLQKKTRPTPTTLGPQASTPFSSPESRFFTTLESPKKGAHYPEPLIRASTQDALSPCHRRV